MVAQGVRSAFATVAEADRRQVILGVAALMIAGQLAFRAWALFPSWFYTDDYTLLIRASEHDLPGPAYLAEPFNGHVMPLGRLAMWLVANSGTTNWALAVTLTLVLQALASTACLWMLHTLFGARWGNLALLALYLTSAMGMPVLMWWTACLTQLPVQLAIFLAVGTWVNYLRTRRLLWCGLAAASLLLGLTSDTRAMLIAPLLLYIMVMYFTTGGPRQRWRGVRRYWPALVAGAVIAVGYTVYYALEVTAPLESAPESGGGVRRALEVADSMLGVALTTGAVGGPWAWFDTTPPIVLAAPPDLAVHAAWVVIALTLAYSLLTRVRVLRGWLLLLGFALGLYVLLIVTRGQLFGRLAGMEYRYLADMIAVIPVGLGLVFMTLRGAPDSSAPRADPLLRRDVPTWAAVALVGLITVGGLVSSVRYVRFWHEDNASKPYVANVQNGMNRDAGRVDLPNQMVPEVVMPGYTAPNNITRNFIPLLAGNVRFPNATSSLRVLDGAGQVRTAEIRPVTRSRAGASDDCAHRITSEGAEVELVEPAPTFTWWMRIGYIASAGSPVTVRAGDSTVKTRVRQGLHSLFVEAQGPFDSVEFDGLDEGTVLCVDTVEVGDAVPKEGG